MRVMKKIFAFFNRYINGTKGVISLFLAILMVPFVTIAGALINAGRLNSTVAMFDEALCNASNSTLGTYDEFLRSRFNLMALSQNNSKVAKQLGISYVEYTSDNFVEDLFVYYMEQNLGTLSSTYDTTSLTATGVYPLGDTDVLKSAILQTSKITVPAKMVAEWGSLEDLINEMVKPFKLFSSIATTLSDGATVVGDIDKMNDAKDALDKEIDKCNTARTEYKQAYTEFEKAVKEYNTLVDNINSTQKKLDDCQKKVDALDKKVSDINEAIANKEQEIKDLKEDKKNDHSAEIQTLEDEIEALKIKREETAPGYNQAVSDRDKAKTTLQKYKKQYSTKHSNVVKTKSTYYSKIVAMQEAINNTKKKAKAFQSACESLVKDAEGFVSSATKTGMQAAKDNVSYQKNI